MNITIGNPASAPQPLGPYSQVARVDMDGGGALLYLSGQVAEGDGVAAQSRGIFEALSALLAAHGATLDDVINIRTFMTDLGDLPAYAAVRTGYLTATPPTSTTVEVPRLFRPQALIEIDVVAAVRAA
ncbi:RidA family protein [Streptomyces sp. NPDC047525]|uniref:RidA family protein n=1 Tax=Streptomyces sp. NPDC047525 TaxID=3155264 RepID=UPI0033F7C0E4